MKHLGPLLSAGMLLLSCGKAIPAKSETPVVLGSFYPLAFVAEEVGKDLINVQDLTPPGAEPHDLELTADTVKEITRASLIVYIGGGFQPAVQDAVKKLKAKSLDVSSGLGDLTQAPARENPESHRGESHEEEEADFDPHLWLDPLKTADIGQKLAGRLAQVDRKNAAAYRSNAENFEAKLLALDGEFRKGLERCERRELVTSHEAFGYLAQSYKLTQVGISGLDPEAEPPPGRLAEVADFVKERGVTTIFFEVLVSPSVARTLARETGALTARLDPIEGRPEQGDYFSAMKSNLKELRAGLGCQ